MIKYIQLLIASCAVQGITKGGGEMEEGNCAAETEREKGKLYTK